MLILGFLLVPLSVCKFPWLFNSTIDILQFVVCLSVCFLWFCIVLQKTLQDVTCFYRLNKNGLMVLICCCFQVFVCVQCVECPQRFFICCLIASQCCFVLFI
jgi:hypothetical protein